MIIYDKNLKNIKRQLLTLPNIISLCRIFLIIPCSYFFLKENYIIAAIILIFSAISDMVDGVIARSTNQITKLGEILDPIADKLTLATIMLCMGIKFPEILVFVFALLFKELLMLIAATVLLKLQILPPPAKWYGKIGTIFFYFSVIIIVGLKAHFNFSNRLLSFTLLAITTGIMIFALIKYFILFLELIETKKKVPQNSN